MYQNTIIKFNIYNLSFIWIHYDLTQMYNVFQTVNFQAAIGRHYVSQQTVTLNHVTISLNNLYLAQRKPSFKGLYEDPFPLATTNNVKHVQSLSLRERVYK